MARVTIGRAGQDAASGELRRTGPLGVYVHFPFCSVRCPYCDFAVDDRAEVPHDRYADAVIAEIGARAPWFGGGQGAVRSSAAGRSPRLASIYLGGGTPGLWRPSAIGRVIEAVRRAFGGDGDGDDDDDDDDADDDDDGHGRDGDRVAAAGDVGSAHLQPLEVTVEANPGEVSAAGLGALRAAGVNRLSLGVQALDDRLLRGLGRNHDAAAATSAMRAARAAGFDNVSMDLMFGLPEQSLDDWRRSIDGVLELGPEHVSAYALTIERATAFGSRSRRGELAVPDDEQVAAMQEWARDALAAAGFLQYEVSSHARGGRQAVHNSLYWRGAAYLGVGASAASFRPLTDGGGWRFSNPRSTESYLDAVEAGSGALAPARIEKRDRSDLENEAVWLGLRTAEGIARGAHATRFGADPLVGREAEIARAVACGWLEVSEARVRPTATGLMCADELATRLWR